MLERFKVPLADQVRVPHESLHKSVAAIFEKMGTSAEDALVGADVLVATDLRGVETHGVSNMLRYYVDSYQEGSLNATPNWRIVRESPGTATVDGDKGLAVILGPTMMKLAIEKARKVGVGIVTIRHSGHSGAIGHHAMLAARENMIGVTMTAGGVMVAPTFAAEGRLGTNPIAIAAPARNEPFLLFDAATSAVAGNKIYLAERVGADMLPGWVADKNGTPFTEPVPVPPRGEYVQLPMGGTREQGSHKGYGFALIAEILSTLLSGGLPTMIEQDGPGHHFAAYDIEAFTDLDRFKDTMDRMLKKLRDTPPAPGNDRVLYPGLSEHEEEIERRTNGIPLHKEVVEWFDNMSAELSLPLLERL